MGSAKMMCVERRCFSYGYVELMIDLGECWSNYKYRGRSMTTAMNKARATSRGWSGREPGLGEGAPWQGCPTIHYRSHHRSTKSAGHNHYCFRTEWLVTVGLPRLTKNFKSANRIQSVLNRGGSPLTRGAWAMQISGSVSRRRRVRIR
jgi:hypothetical protein